MISFQSHIFKHVAALIALPDRPHIEPSEGGHLVVLPLRSVQCRLELNPKELLCVEFCTRLAGRSLLELGFCDWINVQENGNWSLSRGQRNHMHVHIYGRAKSAIDQPFGEALKFPLFRELDGWHHDGFSASQTENLRKKCEALSQDADSHTFLSLINSSE